MWSRHSRSLHKILFPRGRSCSIVIAARALKNVCEGMARIDRESLTSLSVDELHQKVAAMGAQAVESFGEKIRAVDLRLKELNRGSAPKFAGERGKLLELRGCFAEKVRHLINEQRRLLERQNQKPGGRVHRMVTDNIRALEGLLADPAGESSSSATANARSSP